MKRLLITALLLLTGCNLPLGFSDDCGDECSSVVIIGDSLVYQSQDELEPLLTDYRYQVHGLIGTETMYEVGCVGAAASESPDLIVVALGTNDYLRGHVPQVAEIVQAAHGTPLVWIVPEYGSEAILAGLAGQERVTVARWDQAVIPAYRIENNVHYNTLGQLAYAEFIAEAIYGRV